MAQITISDEPIGECDHCEGTRSCNMTRVAAVYLFTPASHIKVTLAVEGEVQGTECACMLAHVRDVLVDYIERDHSPSESELRNIETVLSCACGGRATAIEILAPTRPAWLMTTH